MMAPTIEVAASTREFERARDWFAQQIGADAYERVREQAASSAATNARATIEQLFRFVDGLLEASRGARDYLEFQRHFAPALKARWPTSESRDGVASLAAAKGKGGAQQRATAAAKQVFAAQAAAHAIATRKRAIEAGMDLKFETVKRTCASCVASDEFVAKAELAIWDMLTPPLHGTCDCKVKAVEHFEFKAKTDPMTDAEKRELAAYMKKQLMAVQVAMKKAASQTPPIDWITAPDGTQIPTRRTQMGPCLSAAIDTKTGKISFAVNQNHAPNNKCLAPRIAQNKAYNAAHYQKYDTKDHAGDSDAVKRMSEALRMGFRGDYGHPGHHAEVHAVAAVLGDGNCSNMKHVAIFNVRLDGTPMEYGKDMPCCRHCGYVLGAGHEHHVPAGTPTELPDEKVPLGVPQAVDDHPSVMKLADPPQEGEAWAPEFTVGADGGAAAHDGLVAKSWEQYDEARIEAQAAKQREREKAKQARAAERAAREAEKQRERDAKRAAKEEAKRAAEAEKQRAHEEARRLREARRADKKKPAPANHAIPDSTPSEAKEPR